MKKGKKEIGVTVACIPEHVVANVAATLFPERATATSDLTMGFVLPHATFPQIQLSPLSPPPSPLGRRALSTHPLRRPRPQIQRRPRTRPSTPPRMPPPTPRRRRPPRARAPTPTSTPPAPPSPQAPEVSTPAPPSPYLCLGFFKF